MRSLSTPPTEVGVSGRTVRKRLKGACADAEPRIKYAGPEALCVRRARETFCAPPVPMEVQFGLVATPRVTKMFYKFPLIEKEGGPGIVFILSVFFIA